jgi:precorrin-6B methylase 2
MRSNEMGCPSTLNTVNNLVCQDGIWRHETEVEGLKYSDGLHEEAGLRQTLEEADDLSWNSPEVGPPYDSWAQEYHLSNLRANLLRGLKLPGSAQVLEIGAGCGAVTRYLGDAGCRVDAVEGGLVRAELARDRCVGLDQVSIIHSDFHQLNLPDHHYDLALFIGVLEYAQRFAPSGLSAKEAVLQMLRKAMDALSPKGQVIIAIENRLGAKYLTGWPEDHLGTSWTGIAGYPEPQGFQEGIRTFDRLEWEGLFTKLNLKCRFFFPLPDYKLPKAVISDSGVDAPGVESIWGRYVSVNRTAVAPPSAPARFQQNALYRSGLFATCADSFGIVLANTDEVLEEVLPYDWIVFEDPAIDVEHGISLARGASALSSFPDSQPSAEAVTLPRGEPLFQYWLRCAVASHDRDSFLRLVSEQLLSAVRAGNLSAACALLVDDAGEILAEPFPWPDAKSKGNTGDVYGWAETVLDQFSRLAKTDLESLPEMEEWEGKGGVKRGVLDQLKRDLEHRIDSTDRLTFPAIYWTSRTEGFSEKRKSVVRCPVEGAQSLVFSLPEPVSSNMFLRLDPSDHNIETSKQAVIVEKLCAYAGDDESGFDLMPALTGGDAGLTHQLSIVAHGNAVVLDIQGNDPWVVIDLASIGLAPGVEFERVEARLRWRANE